MEAYTAVAQDSSIKPFTTDSSQHAVARKIISSGLNPKGTLYSWRRSFAQLIVDMLSNQTASTLMGHTPHTKTLGNAYVGDFGTMNMTSLMMDHDPSEHTSMNPLLTPAAFKIPDVKKYQLSEDEKRVALQDKTLDQLLDERMKHRASDNDDKQEKSKLNAKIKSRRRILIMRALKIKYTKIIEDMENFMEIGDDGQQRLNEDKLLKKYGAIQKKEEAIFDISSQLPLHDQQDIDCDDESISSEEDDEDSAILNDNDDQDDVDLEVLLDADEVVPEAPVNLATDTVATKRLMQIKYIHLKKFVFAQSNTHRKQKCILCVQEGRDTNIEYNSLKQYAAHLYQGGAQLTPTAGLFY